MKRSFSETAEVLGLQKSRKNTTDFKRRIRYKW